MVFICFICAFAHAYNTSFNMAIGESPYYLIYGRSPSLPTDVIFDTPQLIYENISNYASQLRLAHAVAPN